MNKKNLLTAASALLLVAACKKEYDHPPLKELSEGQKINIFTVKKRVSAALPLYLFAGGDTSLYCTVTADESSGSLYRQVYVRDDEGAAILVNLLAKGGLYLGDRLRVNLNGVKVRLSAGMYSLDSVDLEKNIVKLSSGSSVNAKSASIPQIQAGAVSGSDLQSQLVELSGVEFVFGDRGVELGDAVGRSRKDLVITDCNSNTITLSTSGYANYASELTPSGNGRITAIVTRYENQMNLELRKFSDLSMQDSPCTSSATATGGTFVLGAPVSQISENFSSITDLAEFSQEGWINYNEAGKTRWKGNVKAVIYKAIRATAFGTGEKNLTWLISPPVIYQSGLKVSFKSGIEYFKPGHTDHLVAFVSTNFNGQNFKTANWTLLPGAVYAGGSDGNYSGSGGLRSSGEIDLKEMPLFSGFTGNFFVAFRYSGEPGFDSNVYLDDVVVQ
jgi:hypothetical protein